jgi:hypothetical protein
MSMDFPRTYLMPRLTFRDLRIAQRVIGPKLDKRVHRHAA